MGLPSCGMLCCEQCYARLWPLPHIMHYTRAAALRGLRRRQGMSWYDCVGVCTPGCMWAAWRVVPCKCRHQLHCCTAWFTHINTVAHLRHNITHWGCMGMLCCLLCSRTNACVYIFWLSDHAQRLIQIRACWLLVRDMYSDWAAVQ